MPTRSAAKFFQTVNGTLIAAIRHAILLKSSPFLSNFFSMRKYLLLCIAAFLLHQTAAFAQYVAPADTTFPFNVTLVSPDSTVTTTSKTLLRKGEVTVLTFWLTTCYPCQIELDVYTRNYPVWKEQVDFRLIAISTDFPDRFRLIDKRIQEKKYPFEVWWDRYRGFSQVLPGQLNGLPQIFIFDKQGRLAWRHKGFYSGLEQEMMDQVVRLSQE